MSDSILVFGATGFIGGSVARKLKAKGSPVVVFKRPASKLVALEDVEVRQGDLNDAGTIRQAAQGIPKIIFAAAYYPVVSRDADSQLMMATRQVENLFSNIDPAADVVYVSSISTIGRCGGLSDETTPYDEARLRSTYYRIKYAMEKIALVQSKQRQGRTVIVNPAGVFGDFDVKPTTSRVVIDAAKGHLVFKLHGPLNGVDIRDVVDGILSALERGRNGERYILGGENTTIEEFLQLVCDVVGRNAPIFPLPFGLVRAAAEASEWLHAALKRSGAPLLPVVGVDLMENAMHVTSEKARRELGYSHGPLRPALERAYRWFLEQGYLQHGQVKRGYRAGSSKGTG